MADTARAKPADKSGAVVATEPTEIESFAAVVAGMTRFISRLAKIPAFNDAEVGLSEWSVMIALSSVEQLGNRQLSRQLAVSPQRINQIAEILKAQGFISVKASEADARQNEISLTESGKRRLAEVNRNLEQVISEAMEDSARRITGLKNNLRHLMRIVAKDKIEKPAG